MKANVRITLEVVPEKKHYEYVKQVAAYITNDINSICFDQAEGKILKTTFSVPKKTQLQLAEEIRKNVSWGLDDYAGISVSFEK